MLGGLGGDGLLELLDEPKDDGLIEDCFRIDRLVTWIGKKNDVRAFSEAAISR